MTDSQVKRRPTQDAQTLDREDHSHLVLIVWFIDYLDCWFIYTFVGPCFGLLYSFSKELSHSALSAFFFCCCRLATALLTRAGFTSVNISHTHLQRRWHGLQVGPAMVAGSMFQTLSSKTIEVFCWFADLIFQEWHSTLKTNQKQKFCPMLSVCGSGWLNLIVQM